MDGGDSWSAHAADLIQWFHQRRAELSLTPLPLNGWTQVTDPATFYSALSQDIAYGPQGPRAVLLVEDLEDLFAWWSREYSTGDSGAE